jgi:PAS domain S-box-containing protein
VEQENWDYLEPTITTDNDLSCMREKVDLDSSGSLSGDFHITHNVTEGKKVEEVLHHTEKHILPEIDIIVSSSRDIEDMDLADIIDVQAVQSLMDDFYKFAPLTMALVDLKGNVLVSVGWRDICTRFHRVNPETCKHCVESDTKLSAGVLPGEFKLYRCKNNMWDIATPIMVGGQHIGNIFSGQFFFENEPLDYEVFRAQARKYGFNEEEYIAALEKVPRLSREAVETGMTFLTKLAHMISQLSYSNVKLSRSLVERDALVNSLRESEEKYRSVVETANEGIWIIDAEDRTVYVNKKMAEMLGYTQDEMIGKSGWDFTDEKDKSVPRLNREKRQQGIDESHEFKFICKDGSPVWTLVNTKSFFDGNGKFAGSMGMLTEITERKEAEAKLKEAYEYSEKLVKERSAQLEKAYNSLKESQEGLAEAQKMAHIGNWEWDIAADKAYWSEEMYRIFGRDPKKEAPPYEEYLSYIHPDDLDHYCDAIKKAARDKPFSIDYRIVLANGEERTVHLTSKYVMDNKNLPVKIKGTVQDITERKNSEEKIQLLANIVKSSNDAIGTISLDGIITSCNEEAEKVYGYSVEEILGKNASILAPPHLDKETIKLIEKIKQREQVNNFDTLRLRKEGKTINVSITLSPVFDTSGKLTNVSFISRDITKRKEAEETLAKIEIARKQEIHHRIKNNLQVISSLLDLQAEKFRGKNKIEDSNVLEAFKESQDRVISMALIHEELHKGGELDTLNISNYIEELADNLLSTYRVGNNGIILDTDIEEDIFFDMDTSIPLSIIINEIISNSLKHAFSGRDKGEIRIKLHREGGCNTPYILSVSDNGTGIPEDLEIKDLDSLGLQLVTTLVEQLDGELELKRNNGTEFIIRFGVTGNNDQELASGQLQLADNE